MGIAITGFEWFVNNILGMPELFIGLIVLIGYALLKKPFYECFEGFVKATVGYMILNVGAGGLVSTFRPILAGLKDRFHLNAAVIDPYFGLNAVYGALKSINVSMSYTMIALLIGFILNILLVIFRKYTKIRTLFTTGHIMVQQSATVTWMVFWLMPEFRGISGATMVGILVGLYWAVGSNLTVGPTQRLTGGANFAVGHQQMFAIWLADRFAPKFGDPKKNLENIKLPKWLNVFNDNVVATATLMTLFFGTIMIILGQPFLKKIDPVNFTSGLSFPIYILTRSFSFAVYLSILMQGVRMFVAELTNSFQGISNKILPGSLPAVDVAATYNFGPTNAVLFGFIFGAIGQFISIMGLLVFKSPILIITGFVPVFFDNAAVAVFANKRGGVRAAVILSFISGVLQVLISALAVTVVGLYKFGGWHGSTDFEILWTPVLYLFKYFHFIGFVLLVLFFLGIPLLQYSKAKDKVAYSEGKQ